MRMRFALHIFALYLHGCIGWFNNLGSSEEENYSEEEDYSKEEGSGPEEGTERDDCLLARIRSLEELEAELERAEEKRALALEKERIAAQEQSCKELKLEAMRAESSSDGSSTILVSSTAEEVHMPRDLVPYLKEGVNTHQEVQGYEVAPVMRRVPEVDWGTGMGSHIPTCGRESLLTLGESDRERGSPEVEVLVMEFEDIPEEC
ncbi:hypothetical protein NDU88_003852 [Pleurodeles waltl]|uniref:Uncharacterized protein n=1 Tax=Pleurodeles waltl TaxID=8319 RepID=A0AAV7SH55_PLEWA|nr:hypothetical protein NDU88_003852 [Pleurodeles waltl]